MNVIDFRRRIARIEEARQPAGSMICLSDQPMTGDAEIPGDWREQVADGRMKLRGRVLTQLASPMTLEGWAERHVKDC